MRASNWLWLAALLMAAPACKQQGSGSLTAGRQDTDQVKQAEGSPRQAEDAQKKAGKDPDEGEQQIAGKVAQVSDTELRLDSAPQPLKIDSSTQVTLDGQPASAAQLQPGSDVRASFRRDGSEVKAIKIDAKSANK